MSTDPFNSKTIKPSDDFEIEITLRILSLYSPIVQFFDYQITTNPLSPQIELLEKMLVRTHQ